MTLQNVTVSLPAEMVKDARHLAVDRGLSLSRFIASLLEDEIRRERLYQQAMERELERMEKGMNLGTGGRISWTRDSLYER